MPITAKDLENYLQTRSDFELELFVYRTLREGGFVPIHGGTYIDPATNKPRQFDIRAHSELYQGHAKFPVCRLALAIECKSLSTDAPLLVSRVPRPVEDAYHQLMHSWQRQNMRDASAQVLSLQGPRGIYRPDDMVGKRTAQVRRDGSGAFKDDDRDPYEKWSQALASVADLVQSSAISATTTQHELSLTLPVLVVADGTLWVADYSEDGTRRGVPYPADAVELLVDRDYPWEVAALPGPQSYRISHLHIYTRAGLVAFIQAFSRPGDLHTRMFDFAIRQLLLQ